jgi:phosphoribosyl-AMP cyclohydrolase
MENRLFKHLEAQALGHKTSLTDVLDQLQFNEQGLIPAVAQQHDSGEVLMMAWMSREALEETLATGRVCYWSRSRQALWRKGESSGNIQTLIEMRLDCDGDTLLCLVDQVGPACHTDRSNCFYLRIGGDDVSIIANPVESA